MNEKLPHSAQPPVGSAPSVDALLACIRQEETPWLEKRRLLKQTYRAIYQAREVQLAEALRVQQAPSHANATIAEIQDTYLRILAEIGLPIETAQQRLIADLGERLTTVTNGLAEQDIDNAFKQRIREMANRAFLRLFTALDELTDDLFTRARGLASDHEHQLPDELLSARGADLWRQAPGWSPTPACPSLPRLERGARTDDWSDQERRHLAGCAYCRKTLAIARRLESPPASTPPEESASAWNALAGLRAEGLPHPEARNEAGIMNDLERTPEPPHE